MDKMTIDEEGKVETNNLGKGPNEKKARPLLGNYMSNVWPCLGKY